jgi:membrane protease YdiL (CAAX protease family)
MIYALIYQFGIFLLVVLALALVTRQLRSVPLLLALVLLSADIVITVCTPQFIPDPVPGLHWNWVGKAASILFAVLVLSVSARLRLLSGITVRQAKGSRPVSLLLIAFLAALAVYLDRGTPLAKFSSETLLFQTFMPTISEELIFRGSALALMTLALPAKIGVGRWTLNAGTIATCALFGIGHSVSANGAALAFSAETMIWTTLIGVVLTILRLRSGSVVAPMIGHTVFNVISEGLPMFVPL